MSLVVTLDVHGDDGRGRIGLVVVKNVGPTADVEGEDPGGERRYHVHMSDGLSVTDTTEVTHVRRDGALALAAKALSVLAAASRKPEQVEPREMIERAEAWLDDRRVDDSDSAAEIIAWFLHAWKFEWCPHVVITDEGTSFCSLAAASPGVVSGVGAADAAPGPVPVSRPGPGAATTGETG